MACIGRTGKDDPMKLRIVLVVAALLALLPATAYAQEPTRGILGRISGNLVVAEDDLIEGVIVIDGDATIEGVVDDFVLVIDGTLTISGEVRGDVTVISGRLVLLSGSSVKDISLIDSNLERASGATVTGDVNERERFFFRGVGAIFSLLKERQHLCRYLHCHHLPQRY
jgi:hypothetical protein